jgi:hypothetical protein
MKEEPVGDFTDMGQQWPWKLSWLGGFHLSIFQVILGFPNPAPSFSECANFLPIFSGKEEDNLAQHLVKFHQCIDQLDVYHEDSLMKMFIYSLDGDAQKWFWSLPASSISSLKEFHATFNKYCKRYYSTDTLLKDCL